MRAYILYTILAQDCSIPQSFIVLPMPGVAIAIVLFKTEFNAFFRRKNLGYKGEQTITTPSDPLIKT